MAYVTMQNGVWLNPFWVEGANYGSSPFPAYKVATMSVSQIPVSDNSAVITVNPFGGFGAMPSPMLAPQLYAGYGAYRAYGAPGAYGTPTYSVHGTTDLDDLAARMMSMAQKKAQHSAGSGSSSSSSSSRQGSFPGSSVPVRIGDGGSVRHVVRTQSDKKRRITTLFYSDGTFEDKPGAFW